MVSLGKIRVLCWLIRKFFLGWGKNSSQRRSPGVDRERCQGHKGRSRLQPWWLQGQRGEAGEDQDQKDTQSVRGQGQGSQGPPSGAGVQHRLPGKSRLVAKSRRVDQVTRRQRCVWPYSGRLNDMSNIEWKSLNSRGLIIIHCKFI